MTKQDQLAAFTRIGFAARGLVYILIGYFVLAAGRAQGAEEVIAYVGDGGGKWLVVAMAAGFAAYGLWRLGDAALATEHPGDGNKALVKRAAAGVSGIVHLFLAWQALKLALGAAQASSGGTDQQAQTVLQLPGGQLLLAIAAIVLGVAGVAQLVIASKCSFLHNLDARVQQSWVKWLGRAGYASRGAVFLVAAYYVLTAALDQDSSQAGGIEQVLAWLSHPIDWILAAGLFLFGVYGLVEARYRRIHLPDVDGLAREARGRLAG